MVNTEEVYRGQLPVICQQEVKKAILDDLVRLGKASGLHSFEQVGRWQQMSNHILVMLANPYSIFFIYKKHK